MCHRLRLTLQPAGLAGGQQKKLQPLL